MFPDEAKTISSDSTLYFFLMIFFGTFTDLAKPTRIAVTGSEHFVLSISISIGSVVPGFTLFVAILVVTT